MVLTLNICNAKKCAFPPVSISNATCLCIAVITLGALFLGRIRAYASTLVALSHHKTLAFGFALGLALTFINLRSTKANPFVTLIVDWGACWINIIGYLCHALSCLSCRDRFIPENLNPLLVLAFLSSHFVLSALFFHCNRGTPYQLRKPTQRKLQATSICNKFLKKSNLRTLHLPSLQTPAFTQTPFFAHVTPRHLLYELTPKIEKLACTMFRHIDINYEGNLQ